jgi:glycosyltransferase involved in cell wall biosynthesis
MEEFNNDIKKILLQTYSNWELVICDSSSNDGTLEMINDYIKKDKRIKIISYEDSGVADALNRGFQSCEGNVLCWLNSDDMYANKHVLEKVSLSILDNDYLIGNFYNIDPKNVIIKSFYSYLPFKKINKIFYLNQIFTGSLFFRKKCFNFLNIKYKYAFEYELLIHLLKNFNGKYIDVFLSASRIRNESLSSNKKKLQNEFYEILKKNNLKYSNSLFLRLKAYSKQNVLRKVIINKFFDKKKINYSF